jgi:hypothetical protein
MTEELDLSEDVEEEAPKDDDVGETGEAEEPAEEEKEGDQ